jgi:ComEC/Rec2-related protein
MIAGIVLAMLLPADPAFLPYLQATTLVFMLGGAVYLAYRRRLTETQRGAARVKIAEWSLLIIVAALMGYARYIAANTVPDTRYARVELGTNEARMVKHARLPDTCRLRIRKTDKLDEDLVLQLKGTVRVRTPVTDQEGEPVIDAEGRWRFRTMELEQASDPIAIRAEDPIGTDYYCAQPFNRVTGLEVLSGPSEGQVTIYRISNHIGSFVRPGRNSTPVTILGRITADPWGFGYKTVLRVSPDFVQYRPGGTFYPVEGGDVRTAIKPRMTHYALFSQSEAYGFHARLQGELIPGRPQSNPGGFDDQRFLRNHNIFGWLMTYEARGEPAPYQPIMTPDGNYTEGNPLVEFSLALRDRMLGVIKQTMPYPNSAFLGAVTLGLRYGLRGTACLFSGSYFEHVPGEPCPREIEDEFKHAGVNHVLAVSGLHVTIITIMFVGIFTLLRVPRKMYTPIIVLALIIFAIITGARPSTLRAVIMNSLALLTWAYLARGLRSSILLGVAVAAFLILYHNPLMIVDPSFTLSFGAILSLVLLTDPTYALLCKLRGNNLLVFIIAAVLLTWALIGRWFLLTTWQFWIPFALFMAALTWAGRKLEARGVKLIGDASYLKIPMFIGVFIAAQASIQFGMMVPLSAAYFCRWPAGGAYANLLALPLAGIVIQLGVFAGLIGQIPAIGLPIALILNAANWLYSSLFLAIAHYTTEIFPLPFVRKASVLFLVFYYIVIAIYVWHYAIWKWLKKKLAGSRSERAAGRGAIFLLGLALAAAVVMRPRYQHEEGTLDITMIMVNYGTAILVETPDNRKILIDAGFVQRDRGKFNEAVRTILPFLSNEGIRELDMLIVTSPDVERAGGAPHILKHCRVDTLVLPNYLADLSAKWTPVTFEETLRAGDDPAQTRDSIDEMYAEMILNPHAPTQLTLAKAIRARRPGWVNRWAGHATRVQGASSGDVLCETLVGKRRFFVEVLHPDDEDYNAHVVENRSLVLKITYGDFSFLVPGNLHFSGQEDLARQYGEGKLHANVLVAPHHGTAFPVGATAYDKEALEKDLQDYTAPFLTKVDPDWVLFDYGNPGPVYREKTRDARRAFEQTFRFFGNYVGKDRALSTDRDLAIMIHSDGISYSVEPYAATQVGDSGAEGVADLEVGF